MAQKTKRQAGAPRRRGKRLRRWLRRIGLVLAGAIAGYFALCTTLLVAYRRIDPPTTGVQIQRRIESWFTDGDYRKRYRPVPASRISPHLLHAVVAAEDSRFFEHGGVDWHAVGEALEDARRGRRRGGSTVSQQLAKNLFLTTYSSWWRKGIELPLTYLTEAILDKDRILELYVNVAEWGPHGLFGIEAAARQHYGVPAAALTRDQAARLAACLPAPRRRVPARMGRYAEVIEQRMTIMGY